MHGGETFCFAFPSILLRKYDFSFVRLSELFSESHHQKQYTLLCSTRSPCITEGGKEMKFSGFVGEGVSGQSYKQVSLVNGPEDANC